MLYNVNPNSKKFPCFLSLMGVLPLEHPTPFGAITQRTSMGVHLKQEIMF